MVLDSIDMEEKKGIKVVADIQHRSPTGIKLGTLQLRVMCLYNLVSTINYKVALSNKQQLEAITTLNDMRPLLLFCRLESISYFTV